MNKYLYVLVLVAASFTLVSCDRESEVHPYPATGKVKFIFINEVDNQAIQDSSMIYTNEAGNNYSVTLLKYYISNITFTKSDGTEFKAPNYELVDEDSINSKSFFVSVPYGDYTKLRFYMGVDSSKNFAGAQAGELSADYGMFWDWSTGYLYFKHEGEFLDSTGVIQPIVYHYGGIAGLVTEEMNIDLSLPMSDITKVITVTFNLNKVYRSPNVVDFNGNNIQSGAPGWVQTLKENFNGAFEVTDIQ
jgi:hypothetical protein